MIAEGDVLILCEWQREGFISCICRGFVASFALDTFFIIWVSMEARWDVYYSPGGDWKAHPYQNFYEVVDGGYLGLILAKPKPMKVVRLIFYEIVIVTVDMQIQFRGTVKCWFIIACLCVCTLMYRCSWASKSANLGRPHDSQQVERRACMYALLSLNSLCMPRRIIYMVTTFNCVKDSFSVLAILCL